jgi:hypothetical protein
LYRWRPPILLFAEPLPPEERPIDFALVYSGDGQEACVKWISAEGKIIADTPAHFTTVSHRRSSGTGI